MIAVFLALAAAEPSGQLIIDRNRLDRGAMPEMKAPERPQPVDRAAIAIGSDGTGISIRRIEFQGQAVPANVANAAKRFLGCDASPANLQAIAGAMAKAYAKTDVALYGIAIPAQDFAGGTLIVSVTEGYVAAATLENGDEKRFARPRLYLESLIGERPLTRARFERQISLMRDIPGFTLETITSAGSADGAVALAAKPKQKSSSLTFGFNNRGTRSLGNGQFEATAKLFGMATSGDQFSLTAASASDLRNYLYASASYALPLGYDGLNLGLTAAYLQTRPSRSPIRGKAKVLGIYVSFPIIRAFDENLYISGSVDGLNSDNAAFGNIIAAERTRAARAALRYARVRDRLTLSGGLSLSRGVDFAGARALAAVTDLDFFKRNMDVSISQKVLGRIFARLNAGGQWSRDRLPAAERFVVGGKDYGRAFETAVLSADRGLGGSVELAYQPLLGKRLEGTEVYAFADKAAVRYAPRPGLIERHYDLGSAGAGIRLKYRDKAEIGLEAARALDQPFGGYHEKWRLSVDWQISL